MQKLTRSDLYSLERYAEVRNDLRADVLEHKKDRRVPLGPNATLYFEDRKTVQYQVQEMLRAERIFEGRAIEEELEAYNPLIPDGSNWKATFMLEYPDVDVRRSALAQLKGIEDRVYVEVQGHTRVYAIADEDLERENDEKTSSVHFLRFELDPVMRASLRGGTPIACGIDHPACTHRIDALPERVRAALVRDLD